MSFGHRHPGFPNDGRLWSLDAFRGMVLAGMILVTDPGTYAYTWHPLRHAVWNGATATDMIFPAFLFMVGAAIPFSLASQAELGRTPGKTALRIMRRSLTLLLLGLALNGFPDYDWGTLRLPGILQRIAVCYALCAFLYRTPALILGTNAILAFVVSTLLATMLDRIHVSGISPHAYLYQHLRL